MARQPAGKRPQNLRFAVGELLRYMGRHRLLLFAVAALVTISACANLLGTRADTSAPARLFTTGRII